MMMEELQALQRPHFGLLQRWQLDQPIPDTVLLEGGSDSVLYNLNYCHQPVLTFKKFCLLNIKFKIFLRSKKNVVDSLNYLSSHQEAMRLI